ncbi:MAG TPA: hypothetical protein DEP72_05925 [Clostridiales bacterium]|nr:hypothetical protein [Clostridiales bacterium]
MNVRELLDALEKEAELGKFTAYQKISDLQTAILEFLKRKFSQRKSRNTVRTYYSDLISFLEDAAINEFIENETGHIPIEEISREIIINHLNRFGHANRWQNTDKEIESKVSEASIEKRYRSLHAFTSWLLENQIVGIDLMWKIKKPQIKNKIPSAWPYEFIVKFFDTFDMSDIKDYRNATICVLIADTGLRIGEVVGLQEGNIDWISKTFLVSGKTGQRVCAFSDICGQELEKWLKIKNKELPKTSFVFPSFRKNLHGFMMNSNSVTHIVREHARKAGIPDSYKLGPHSLRHAVGAHLARSNVNIKMIQKQFGHANISTTQIYEEISLEDVRDTINSNSLLKKINEIKGESKINNALNERIAKVKKKLDK